MTHSRLNVLKTGWFSFSVRKVNPKYGSTVKNLNTKNFPKFFPVLYVGTKSYSKILKGSGKILVHAKDPRILGSKDY